MGHLVLIFRTFFYQTANQINNRIIVIYVTKKAGCLHLSKASFNFIFQAANQINKGVLLSQVYGAFLPTIHYHLRSSLSCNMFLFLNVFKHFSFPTSLFCLFSTLLSKISLSKHVFLNTCTNQVLFFSL